LVARGWESKAVEAQQEEAARRQSPEKDLAQDSPETQARRATLALARARALADLRVAHVPAHRAMLEQAIQAIDRQIAALGQ
jgi:hypothetical protein